VDSEMSVRVEMERSKRKETDGKIRHLEEGFTLLFEESKIPKEEGI
jgi:hypothetical protein